MLGCGEHMYLASTTTSTRALLLQQQGQHQLTAQPTKDSLHLYM